MLHFLQKMKDDGSEKPVVLPAAGDGKTTPVKSDDKTDIDFDSLRSLSDLGVDMSFLDNMGKFVF